MILHNYTLWIDTLGSRNLPGMYRGAHPDIWGWKAVWCASIPCSRDACWGGGVGRRAQALFSALGTWVQALLHQFLIQTWYFLLWVSVSSSWNWEYHIFFFFNKAVVRDIPKVSLLLVSWNHMTMWNKEMGSLWLLWNLVISLKDVNSSQMCISVESTWPGVSD